jgi:DNA-binding transcriptional LysR family regulator
MDRLDCDRMFVTVMELGSFAAAAARLGTSSGQASKLVSRLEGDLGVRLLNRTTRALSPTEAGQAYFDRVRSILDEFDALDQAVRNVAETPRGRLRLTVPLTFGTTQLKLPLNDFALRYREITLDVQFSDRLVNLVDEGFDAAIRVGRPADSSLIARKLCATRVVVVASDAYLAGRTLPGQPGDLASDECIIDTNIRDPFVWRFRQPSGPLTVAVSGRLRFSNAEACLGAAEAGLGIAMVPDFIAAASLAAGRVRLLLAEYEDAPYGVYALYPPGRHLAAKVRAFVDFMADRFSGPVDWSRPVG